METKLRVIGSHVQIVKAIALWRDWWPERFKDAEEAHQSPDWVAYVARLAEDGNGVWANDGTGIVCLTNGTPQFGWDNPVRAIFHPTELDVAKIEWQQLSEARYVDIFK